MALFTPRLLYTLAFLPFLAWTNPIPVLIDARCPDANIQYRAQLVATATVRAKTTHKLVSDDSATVRVSLSIATVKQKGNSADAPLGVAIATLARKHNVSGAWDVILFTNTAVALEDLDVAIKSAIDESLK